MSYTVALALFASAPAYALTCDEVLTLVAADVPTAVVVDTVASSGEHFSESDLRCLAAGGAPPEVLSAALDLKEHPALALPPAETELPRPPAGSTLRTAVDHRAAGMHRAASVVLAGLPAEPRILYELGRAMDGMGLYHSAQFHYIEALKAGPADPSFASALRQLVYVSEVTGDRSDLARIAGKLPPETFPPSVRDELFYQLGLYLQERDTLSAARKYYDHVGKTSPRYWRAKYMLGAIYSKQGKLKSGVRAFTEVIRESSDRELRDLAQLNLANVYYSIEQFDEAATYFDLPKDSPRYIDSRLRLAWTRFMLHQPVAGILDSIPKDAWMPEAALLSGIDAFNTQRYSDALAEMEDFEATYAPIRLQLVDLLQNYGSEHGKHAADEAFRRYADPMTSPLPSPLLAKLHRNRELQGLVSHLALMEREERLIRRQPQAWRDAFTERLAAVIREDRIRLQRRAGLVMLQGIVRETAYLEDLLRQARILRFESADAAENLAREGGRPIAEQSTALLRELIISTPAGPDRADALVRLAARVDNIDAIAICEGLLAAPPPWWDPSAAAYLLALADPLRTNALMNRIVTEWPSSRQAPTAWLVLGDDHFARGRLAEARAAYEHVAALPDNEHYAYANYKLGWTLHALGDHTGGQERLSVAIQSATDDTLRAHATLERERLAGL